MRIDSALAFTALALTVSVIPLLAHHSVAGEYDMSKTITIQGTITRIEWMNPHARLWVDTKNDDATVSTWELELPPPNVLARLHDPSGLPNNGSKNFFKQGDQITVTLWRAKNGTLLGNALSITFSDGRTMDLPRGWIFKGATANLTNSK